MRSLIILLLIGAAVASDSLIRSRRDSHSGYGKSMGSVRIDAQEMRMAQLSEQLEQLEEMVGDGEDQVPASMDMLEKRLGTMEGSDCPSSRPFSCGRHSGQCVYGLSVCDGVKDCENNADEEESFCENPVPAGRSWSGTATWDSCLVRSNNQFSLLITGNKRYDHFKSRMWVDAVLIESYTVNGVKHDKTWMSHGHFDYSNRILHLGAPAGSDARIAMQCADSGPKTTFCTFITEGGIECGTATLTRG